MTDNWDLLIFIKVYIYHDNQINTTITAIRIYIN